MLSQYIHTLQELGLSEKEAHVYIALLEYGGRGHVRNIAENTHIPRTSLYDILSHLESLGLLSYVGSKKSEVQAVSPSFFFDMIKNEEKRIETLHTQVATMVPDMERIVQPRAVVSSICEITDMSKIKDVWQEQLISLHDSSYFAVCTTMDMFPVVKNFLQHVQMSVRARILLEQTDGEAVYMKTNTYEVKTLEAHHIFGGTTTIVPSSLCTIAVKAQTATFIQHAHVASTHYALFDHLWSHIL